MVPRNQIELLDSAPYSFWMRKAYKTMDSEIVRVKSKVSWNSYDFTSLVLKLKRNNGVIGSLKKKSGVKVRRHMETGVSSAFLEAWCFSSCWLVKKISGLTLTCTGVWKCTRWHFVCSLWLQLRPLHGDAWGSEGEMWHFASRNNEVKKQLQHYEALQTGLCEHIFWIVGKAKHVIGREHFKMFSA